MDIISKAEEFEKECNWKDAISIYEDLLKENKSVYILSKLAWCYSRYGNYSSAKNMCNMLIEIEPNNAKWYYMLGYQFYIENNWLDSIKYFERSLLINPEYFVVLYRISYAYLKCAGEYLKLTKAEYWKAIGYLNKAHTVWKSFDESSKKQEKDTYFHICYLNGKAFMLISNKNEEAIYYFNLALSLKEDSNCRYNLCKSLFYSKKYEEAKNKLPNENKFYINELKAQIYFKLDQFDEAIKIVNSLIKYRKKDYLYCLLSEIYISKKDFKSAYNAACTAVKDNYKNHKNHYTLALAYYNLGLLYHAVDELKLAQNLKQKRYNSDYFECNTLLKKIESKIDDNYKEDEMLLSSISLSRSSHTGFIEDYNSKRGYGFINCDKNSKMFFHISNVKHGKLKKGDKVKYNIKTTNKGKEAINVTVIN